MLIVTLAACRTGQANSVRADAFPATSPSMCLSVMGNGQNFSSHVGVVTALLERGLDPKVVAGASSGSLMTPFVRLILSNPSVRKTAAKSRQGVVLSVPQKGARVLSALSPILENFLFLPAANQLMNFLRSLIEYYKGVTQADAFIGDPNVALAHLEAVSGQIAVAFAFLKTADFSQVVQENDIKKRILLVQAMWLKAGDFIEVTPGDFINAMLTPRDSAQFTPHFREIRERYFKIFRTALDNPGGGPADYEHSFDNLLTIASPVLGLLSPETKTKMFGALLGQAKALPIVGGLMVVLAKPFYMINPDLTWQGYLGNDLNGQPLLMPPELLINTTALAASGQDNAWVERAGRQYLYQGYYGDAALIGQLKAAKAQIQPPRGFLEYESPDGYKTLMDPQHIFFVTGTPLISAVKASIAEPDTMRRGPIEWTPGDDGAAQGLPLAGDTLISYGGWLERIAFATQQRLSECQEDRVDYMVHISADAIVNDFQLQSLRKAIEGDRAFNSSTPIDGPMKDIYYDLLNFMTGVKRRHGVKGTLAMEFDWNHPSTAADASVRPAMDQAIQSYRSGMMLAAYQYASAQLDLVPDLPQGKAVKTLAFGDLSGVNLRAAPDEATLHQWVDKILF